MKVYEIQDGFGLGHVKAAQRSVPVPGPGQVLLKIKAVSLNSRDLGIIDGFYFPDLKLPFIPVSDCVGEVVSFGSQASKFKIGDRVNGIFLQKWISGELTKPALESTLGSPLDGVLAEYAVLDEEGLVLTPEHLTDEEAAALPCAGVTAWNAIVTEGNVKAGDTVVVQGTGGVSLFALQFAKLHGAKVIVTSSSGEKLERAKALGADIGNNYRQNPDWDQAVLEQTHGRGADLVVDLGGASTLNRSISALRIGGTISMTGVLSGVTVERFDIVPAIRKKARLQAINVGSRDMFEEMNRAIVQNELHPVVDRVFPFEQAVEALQHLAAGAHFGKICIKI
ncbi:zinc-dependent alcohol dehydrogenase family protein [Paenibacillus beijingensis]|uniref:NADPH:quinone oxidoreductase n=1 Tax=Paenibacillus beijingensis TaxID=1126833 RepID=A0A0D5NEI9_9BACL|nr:NAD(P)-dependent alcohol dehydrogenase [Paenibacillus beijingensis]AJY73580.1 NADPH:quinone oxidoreductase [Paenibacillus beijingensis]